MKNNKILTAKINLKLIICLIIISLKLKYLELFQPMEITPAIIKNLIIIIINRKKMIFNLTNKLAMIIYNFHLLIRQLITKIALINHMSLIIIIIIKIK